MGIPAREGAATTRALVQANTPPLLMNADPAEGLCVTRSRGARSGTVVVMLSSHPGAELRITA